MQEIAAAWYQISWTIDRNYKNIKIHPTLNFKLCQRDSHVLPNDATFAQITILLLLSVGITVFFLFFIIGLYGFSVFKFAFVWQIVYHLEKSSEDLKCEVYFIY